ncbi:hypothetical protein PR048_026776 [Dryococelus australis]|uniref:NADP-dependent oxidoreductase domain-containing protein n=1 Tax=Dryococelus australis TaxID=614101 RepID=A0ABQ9GMC8_9NEOP|nr:hypothetical protein PR048_026776 [Dryococelus australis]
MYILPPSPLSVYATRTNTEVIVTFAAFHYLLEFLTGEICEGNKAFSSVGVCPTDGPHCWAHMLCRTRESQPRVLAFVLPHEEEERSGMVPPWEPMRPRSRRERGRHQRLVAPTRNACSVSVVTMYCKFSLYHEQPSAGSESRGTVTSESSVPTQRDSSCSVNVSTCFARCRSRDMWTHIPVLEDTPLSRPRGRGSLATLLSHYPTLPANHLGHSTERLVMLQETCVVDSPFAITMFPTRHCENTAHQFSALPLGVMTNLKHVVESFLSLPCFNSSRCLASLTCHNGCCYQTLKIWDFHFGGQSIEMRDKAARPRSRSEGAIRATQNELLAPHRPYAQGVQRFRCGAVTVMSTLEAGSRAQVYYTNFGDGTERVWVMCKEDCDMRCRLINTQLAYDVNESAWKLFAAQTSATPRAVSRPNVAKSCRYTVDLENVQGLNVVRYREGAQLFPQENGKAAIVDLDYVETWKAMEKVVEEGLVRSIGISNFNSEQVKRVVAAAKIKPVTNQVECHPYMNQKKLRELCKQHNIVITAYSPLGNPGSSYLPPGTPNILKDAKLVELAGKHGKSVAQVILRYLVSVCTNAWFCQVGYIQYTSRGHAVGAYILPAEAKGTELVPCLSTGIRTRKKKMTVRKKTCELINFL